METFAYFAHQPILDSKKALYGYELLFRDSDSNVFPDVNEDEATDSLVADSLLGHSLEMLAPGTRCFVNFPRNSLLNGLPSLLSPERLVIEVLETVVPEEDIFTALRSLHENGYMVALDDYCHDPRWEENIDLIGIIKFDLTAQSWEELEQLVQRFRQYPLKLLAEKVETHEDFERTKALGFDFFQGYFFSKPQLVKHRPISANELTVLQLFHAVSSAELDFDKIEQLLSSDVAVSYKLLNVVNHKVGHRGIRIDSIRQAAVYLGNNELRKFVSLVGTRTLNTQPPLELSNMAIRRGFFCEKLLADVIDDEGSQGFMLGLFSLLDVIMERPLPRLVEQLPLSEQLKSALVLGEGVQATVLLLCKAHEAGAWQQVEQLSEELGVESDTSYACFNTATAKAADMMRLVM